jgi:hypothetical protein
MGFFAMLAEEPAYRQAGIYSSTYRYRLHHGAPFLRNINEVNSASAFLFIFSYRAGRNTEYQYSRKP